ncbi:hypothetical protein V2J09_013060 [Rumex salicifolius]
MQFNVMPDNGSEYVIHNRQNCKHGIIHQKAMVYTPFNKIGESIDIHAQFPKKFWGDCDLASTYVINRLRLLDSIGRHPMSCLCFAEDTRPKKDKLDARGRRCIFWGTQLIKRATSCLIWRRGIRFALGIMAFFIRNTSHHDRNVMSL